MSCGLSDRQLQQAFQLRAAVFCRELGWVGRPDQSQESDEFDYFVHHLGIETEDKLGAYLRIHPARAPWMLDRVFAHVVPAGTPLHTPGTCEVSRLAVAREFRGEAWLEGQTMFSKTMQLMFTFCQLNGIHTIFTVVSAPILRLLQEHGLPFKTDDSVPLPKDRNAPVFATLNWAEFLDSKEPAIANHRPFFLETEKQTYQSIAKYQDLLWNKAG